MFFCGPRPAFVAAALFWCTTHARSHELPATVITAHHDDALGTHDAASEGVIDGQTLQQQPRQRPAEIMGSIPGLVVTQHSGDGKANQYFLRGMNLDHGTDLATYLQGVPINLPTHAHGHGYSDLNLLIPELVARIDYRKGPYFAAEGDFSSAGAAHVVYATRLDRPMTSLTLGQRGYQRWLWADSRELATGPVVLMAVERVNDAGPWHVPQGLRKANVQLTLSEGSRREGWRMDVSDYSAHWTATDQVPQRLIDAGTWQGQAFGRFDSLDPSDGGQTRRSSLSGEWHRASAQAAVQVDAYLVRYALQLFSNFTYGLQRPSDQFGQSDERTVLGTHVRQSWTTENDDGRTLRHTLGLQWRQDHIHAQLQETVARQSGLTVRDDAVGQTQIGLYGQTEASWTPWLRTLVGLRVDHLQVRVDSALQPLNSGGAAASRPSPKASVIVGPWARTEFFFNAGHGFHSNDARGITARVDPMTGGPIQAAPALVGAKGLELGLKSMWIAGVTSSLALWQLDFDAELVYAGDTGHTESGRPSRRNGLEWSTRWVLGPQLQMQANLAWTRARYRDMDSVGTDIPNAVQRMANFSMVWRPPGPWSGSLGVRYIGSLPLTENKVWQSAPVATAQLRIGHALSRDLDLSLDALNLTNRHFNDVAYVYTSRVPGESTAVNGLHVHPAEPRTLRVTARWRY